MLRVASASGNVFAYLRSEEAPPSFRGPEWARALCPRGRGLGLDGLFLLHSFREGEPWRMEHWEPDGTLTFCSNGTRAAASVLPDGFRGRIQALVSGERVGLRVDGEAVGLQLPEGSEYGLRPSPLDLEWPHALGWTGTPHLIVEVPDVDSVDLPSFAPPLRFHAALPEGANISIVQILELGRARIRTWERGVEGETLCCGQGCAVAGAWLSERMGTGEWNFRPAGEDAVRISVGGMEGGRWRELWLAGPVRRIGGFEPDPALLA